MGRYVIPIDPAEVERLAGLGLTEKEICLALNIDKATLYRRKRDSVEFYEAWLRGRANAHKEVADQLFQLCKQGNLGAIIWYEKTRRGLSDRVEISAAPEKPIIASEDHHPLAGFARGPITDSSRLLESNGSGSWETVGEDGSWSGDGGDDGSRE